MSNLKDVLAAAVAGLDNATPPAEPSEALTPTPIPVADWSISDLVRWPDLRNMPSKGIRPCSRARSAHGPCRVCPDGAGSLFIWTDRDGNRQRDGVGYPTAVPCVCSDLDGLVNSYNRMALPPEYAEANPAPKNASNPGGTDWAPPHLQVKTATAQKSIRPIVADFINSWVPGGKGLVICGSNGTGKGRTAALICTAIATRQPRVYENETRARRPDVRMVEWSMLVDLVKGNFGHLSEEVVLEPFINADLLWLDEIGKGQRTEWTDAIAERVICRRMDVMKTTIFTTNLPPYASMIEGHKGNDLGDYIGERARSRMMGCCVPYLMVGPDYRRKRHA